MRIFITALSFAGVLYTLGGCTGSTTTETVDTEDNPVSIIQTDKNPYTPIDVSPMDMAYYPADFPIKQMNREIGEALVARVIYSRPHRNGREIFGNDENSLVQYGQEWRLGANEATELDVYRTVNINNTNVEPGRYILYGIPEKDAWTIVLNSNSNTWGLHMDSTKDILRTTVPVMQQEPKVEDFTIAFEKTVSGANLLFVWAGVKVALPMTFSAMP
jgi:hypothetical protein